MSFIKYIVQRPDGVQTTETILRDDAISKFEDDILGFSDIADCIYNDLYSVDVSNHSFSVGIAGEWGSGKSSFLNLLETKIHNGIVVRFYPRSSSKLEDIQDDFFKEFSRAISHYYKSFSVNISRYIRALKLLEGSGIISKTANVFETLYVDDEKKEVNDALQKIGRRIFVIIEDLDRLTAPEILEVFKLIDRNGNFENVIYITAYDKKYVNNILNHMPEHEIITANYTDKYFNYEFTLPAQKQSTINSYIGDFIKDRLLVKSDSLSLDVNFIEEWKRVGQTISSSLSNIRHSKRFINLFQSHYTNVPQDINVGDLLLLTLIRYRNVSVYDALSKGFALTRGGFLQGSDTTIYLVKDYESLLKGIGADNEIINIVRMLFPESGSEVYGGSKYKHIRRSHSFDLYFSDSFDNRLLNKDIIPIFNTEDDNEALDILASILHENRHWAAIEEYLRYSDFDFITNLSRLKRYIKLIILAYHLTGRSLNYYATFGHLFYKSAEDEIATHLSDRDGMNYSTTLYDVVCQMIERCSLSVGLMINSFLKEFQNDPAKIKECVLNSDQLTEIALKCLKFYTENSGESWMPQVSIDLSLIYDVNDNSINKNARNFIIHQFYKRPKEYANSLIRTNVSLSDAGRVLYISFIDYDSFIKLFGGSVDNFDEWMKILPDADMKYVFKALFDAHGRGDCISVPALQENYISNDYKSFRKAIENSIKKEQNLRSLSEECNLVYEVIKKGGEVTIKRIIDDSHLSEVEISQALNLLFKKRLIKSSKGRKDKKYYPA